MSHASSPLSQHSAASDTQSHLSLLEVLSELSEEDELDLRQYTPSSPPVPHADSSAAAAALVHSLSMSHAHTDPPDFIDELLGEDAELSHWNKVQLVQMLLDELQLPHHHHTTNLHREKLKLANQSASSPRSPAEDSHPADHSTFHTARPHHAATLPATHSPPHKPHKIAQPRVPRLHLGSHASNKRNSPSLPNSSSSKTSQSDMESISSSTSHTKKKSTRRKKSSTATPQSARPRTSIQKADGSLPSFMRSTSSSRLSSAANSPRSTTSTARRKRKKKRSYQVPQSARPSTSHGTLFAARRSSIYSNADSTLSTPRSARESARVITPKNRFDADHENKLQRRRERKKAEVNIREIFSKKLPKSKLTDEGTRDTSLKSTDSFTFSSITY